MLSSLLALALSAPGPPELIERVLAVVDGRPVMLSEARLAQRLRGVNLKAALEGVIDERLMFREATRLAQSAVSAEEEERALASLHARGAPPDLPEPALRQLARRQTAILKYVEIRFRPQVRVTEQAVRAAYDREYAGAAGAPTFEEAAPELQRRLADAALGERIEAWVRELRASADIRYNAFDEKGAPPPDLPR